MTNIVLVDSNSKQLYAGNDNIIKITGLENYSNCKMSISYGKVYQDRNKNNEFHIITGSEELLDTLNLYQNDTIILSKIFENKLHPRPEFVRLGLLSDSLVSKEAILSYSQLNPLPSPIKTGYIHVTSFRTLFINNLGDTIKKINTFASVGYLGSKHYKYIMKLTHGDKIVFCNIVASCASCEDLFLPNLTYIIE